MIYKWNKKRLHINTVKPPEFCGLMVVKILTAFCGVTPCRSVGGYKDLEERITSIFSGDVPSNFPESQSGRQESKFLIHFNRISHDSLATPSLHQWKWR